MNDWKQSVTNRMERAGVFNWAWAIREHKNTLLVDNFYYRLFIYKEKRMKNDRQNLLFQKEGMIDYLRLKLEQEDWHGVADAAMDIREIEAKLQVLKEISPVN
jgi:hypothetical protein